MEVGKLTERQHFEINDHDHLINIARKQIGKDNQLYGDLVKASEESGVDPSVLSIILSIPEHEINLIDVGAVDCSIDLIERYASAVGRKVKYSLSTSDGRGIITTDDFKSIVDKVEEEAGLDPVEHAFRMGVGMDNFNDMMDHRKSMTVGIVRRYVNSARMLITYSVR